MRLLKDNKDPQKVQWMILHCQFPQLFGMAQAKKLIDFNQLNLFEHFPNLQGIIAGDLHFGPETKAYGVGFEAYVGYPGSLGQTDISEASDVRRVFYCDGKTLQSLPFPQRRKMIRVDFREPHIENFDVSDYLELCRKEKFKPVLHISWDRNSEKHIHKVFPLYEAAMVHMHQVPLGANLDSPDATTDRSEVSSESKIEKALRDSVKDERDEELVQLSYNLITSTDPKSILDEFKTHYNL